MLTGVHTKISLQSQPKNKIPDLKRSPEMLRTQRR